MVFMCIAPPPTTSKSIQFGINFENERGEIGNENGVLGFGIEVAYCLFDGGEKKRTEIKGGTQMNTTVFVNRCN